MECDAVVHLEDGRWGGIEIKLGGDEKAPSFLLVLTAVGGAYKREDGVCVAPINMLKT